ncbi:DUF427 domain-containing protein [Brumimicrobium aurantiacum]|uniref:DUF427 domain-containing protein n=1 Tax=Brumimicrobium aurantiacum TaxID=1737063 RepID=A0A3E1EZR9_9FLAO|nr:DUF427 domain-containing protein [Brumimicrobium aurantiacum]RFC55069.1 DUF427 domain-containing protein [Brumimicrobium aurantiacum]
MKKAIWNGEIIAESDETIEIEGNAYFPPHAINKEFFINSPKTTFCPWKGDASYYDIKVDNKVNEVAAWYYPKPKEKAAHIKHFIAFWNGIEVK